MTVTRVGLISDTHGLLRPEAVAALAGSEAIIHAGDVGGPEILASLARIAPVTAVCGNVDGGPWAARLSDAETVEIAGRRIHVRHISAEIDLDDRLGPLDVVVTGHSHRPAIARSGGVLWVNPGSAGPRRFRLPVSVATLEISTDAVTARIIELSV